MKFVISEQLKHRLSESTDPVIRKFLALKVVPKGAKKKISYFDLDKDNPNMVSFLPESKAESLKEVDKFKPGGQLNPPLEGGKLKPVWDNSFVDFTKRFDGTLEIVPGSKGTIIDDPDIPEDSVLVRYQVDPKAEVVIGRTVKGEDPDKKFLQFLYKKSVFGQESEAFVSKYRQSSKIGKVLRNFFEKESDAEIENAVNDWYALSCPAHFIVVDGEEIKKYYSQKNYYKPKDSEKDGKVLGTLQGSCMRGVNPNTFDIYCDNPQTVSMLVLVDCKKTKGRAILWTIPDPKDSTKNIVIMDRIYGSDSTIKKYQEYAKDKGWWFKEQQSASCTDKWFTPDNKYKTPVQKTFYIHLDTEVAYTHPYLDSFYKGCEGFLTNNPSKNYKFTYRDQGGGPRQSDNQTWVHVPSRKDWFKESECVYVPSEGEWYLSNDVRYTSDGEPISKAKSTQIKDQKGRTSYCHKEDAVYLSDVGYYVHKDDDRIVKYKGKNYLLENCLESQYTKDMLPKSQVVYFEGNVFSKESLAKYKKEVKAGKIEKLPNPFESLPEKWYVINPTPGYVKHNHWKEVVAYVKHEGLEDLEGTCKYLGYDNSKTNKGWRAFSTSKKFVDVCKKSKWEEVTLDYFHNYITSNNIDLKSNLKSLELEIASLPDTGGVASEPEDK